MKEETIRNLLCAGVVPHNVCCEERIKEKGGEGALDDSDHARCHDSETIQEGKTMSCLEGVILRTMTLPSFKTCMITSNEPSLSAI